MYISPLARFLNVGRLAFATSLLVVPGSIAGPMELPDPLVTEDGVPVETVALWESVRRPEILELFRTHVYGRMPVGKPDDMEFKITRTDPAAMNGAATLKVIETRHAGPGGKGLIRLSVFVPNSANGPVPGFVLICNRGEDNIDPTRKNKSPFWPAEEIVDRGYFAAAFHYADLDPDHHDGFKNGVHGIYDEPVQARPGDAWGSIAAWAWGASRAMDYFLNDADLNASRVGVVGHSRGGKAALWAGAEDQRFAVTFSSCSGCGGAALARRKQGERIEQINDRFPHWFCHNHTRFNGREELLPVDQHQLVALLAPRLTYITSATEDAWADPQGEFLSGVHASPVYQLYGRSGLPAKTMPDPEEPVHAGSIGYHIRTGKHDLTSYDWQQFMNFTDRHWR